jgi:hypothetical protein
VVILNVIIITELAGFFLLKIASPLFIFAQEPCDIISLGFFVAIQCVSKVARTLGFWKYSVIVEILKVVFRPDACSRKLSQFYLFKKHLPLAYAKKIL